MYRYLKINYQSLILILALIVLGTFCLLLSGENFIRMFSYLAAAYLLLMGITVIVFSFRYQEYLKNDTFLDRAVGYFIYGIVLLSLAVLIILYPDYLVRIFIGITLIVFPTIQLIKSVDKKSFLRYNFWKYLVGIIFIIAVDVILEILFHFLGIAFYALAIFLIIMLVRNYHNHEYPNLVSKYIIYIIKRNSKE
jgi:hypothetical protein